MMKWHFNPAPHPTKPPASGYGIQWGNRYYCSRWSCLLNSLPLASQEQVRKPVVQEHYHHWQWLRTVAIIIGTPQVKVTALWNFLASKLSGFGDYGCLGPNATFRCCSLHLGLLSYKRNENHCRVCLEEKGSLPCGWLD